MLKKDFNLKGVEETMIVPLIARAWASKRKNPEFVDASAIQIMDNLGYDYLKFKNSKLNIWGCAARTIVIDQETKEFIKKYPDCSIVNLASGLDDRFSRVDNQKIHWYNIDFKETIDLRKQIFMENDRVTDIASDMFDYKWMEEIKNKENVLVILEGVLMYVHEQDAVELFKEMAKQFTNLTILAELMTSWMVKHQKLHDVTNKCNVKFIWGLKKTEDLLKQIPEFNLENDYEFTKYMIRYNKFKMSLIYPFLKSKNNHLAVLKKVKE